MTHENANRLLNERQKGFHIFESKMFLLKATQGKGLNTITPKKMLQRLLIVLEQLKAGNTSENLLNEIRQILYSLSRAKEITKKAYKNILNLINVLYKMDTIFMISRNSKTSDPHRLLLNLLDKINWKKEINMLLYPTLVYTIHGKI